jgi:hypothetical protein
VLGLAGWGWSRARRRRVGPLAPLWGGLIVSLLLWGQLRHAADRFLAPAILLAMLILGLILRGWAVGAAGRVPFRVYRLRRLAIACGLALWAMWGLWQGAQMLAAFGFADHALGREDRAGYWRRMTGSANAEFWAAADRLPAGARPLAVNEARRYPFRRPVTVVSVFDRSPLAEAVAGADGPERIRARLAAAGFTHLIYNEYELARILAMHTPARLTGDAALARLLATGDREGLVARYAGETEFSVDPPSPAEMAVYRQFLERMRGRAIWAAGDGPQGRPGIWIAPLAAPL